ncbi:hypothetical protein F5884DRAFT_428359 [Xylogone sp. PMI_703]|nr:hypothetical protein F5884DRAFT_428359 [Xylogone sp. PMI_703]
MPNQPVVVSGAIIVVSVAVAAAIAVYESPQARQFAEDVRRRIAIALHSLGDEINPGPNSRQPRFNRPEDADGFYESRGRADPGVDADEESRRRQRDELMYWNAVALEKKEKERQMRASQSSGMNEKDGIPESRSPASRFEDFLEEHPTEKGTYVYNTGSDVHNTADYGLIHRRGGVEGLRGLGSSIYSNPFADEHHIDIEEQRNLMAPDESEKVEILSDIYNASEREYPKSAVPQESTATLVEKKETEPLVDVSETPILAQVSRDIPFPSFEDNNFTNMQANDDAFAAIHAWADRSNGDANFYSPLPVTPQNESAEPSPQTLDFASAPRSPISSAAFTSDDEEDGPGEATPTDSISLAGSGEDIGEAVWGPRSGATSELDVMSVDGESISTPGTWSEVASVVSGDEHGLHH